MEREESKDPVHIPEKGRVQTGYRTPEVDVKGNGRQESL